MNEQEGNVRPDQPKSGTVEAFCDLVKDAPERQIDNGAALDTKMVQIVSAASVVVGLTALSFSTPTADQGVEVTIFLVMAMLAYVATAYVAYQHLRPRRYKRLKLDAIWRYGWYLEPDEARRVIIKKATEAFAHNAPILEDKSGTIRAALRVFSAEVVLVALALIAGRVGG